MALVDNLAVLLVLVFFRCAAVRDRDVFAVRGLRRTCFARAPVFFFLERPSVFASRVLAAFLRFTIAPPDALVNDVYGSSRRTKSSTRANCSVVAVVGPAVHVELNELRCLKAESGAPSSGALAASLITCARSVVRRNRRRIHSAATPRMDGEGRSLR